MRKITKDPEYFSGEEAMAGNTPGISPAVILAGLFVLGIAVALYVLRKHIAPWWKKRMATLHSIEKVMEGSRFHRKLADFLPRFGTKRRMQYKPPKLVILTPKNDPYLKSLIERVKEATENGKRKAIIVISAHEAASWHVPARLPFLLKYTGCMVEYVPKSDGSLLLRCTPKKDAA